MTENTKANDGGAAFPQAERIGDVALQHGGLSIRDYFAAKAMQALIGQSGQCNAIRVTEGAYKIADAMLKARERQ